MIEGCKRTLAVLVAVLLLGCPNQNEGGIIGNGVSAKDRPTAISPGIVVAEENESTEIVLNGKPGAEPDPVTVDDGESGTYIEEMFALASGDPATQAEIYADARAAARLTPNTASKLRYDLILAANLVDRLVEMFADMKPVMHNLGLLGVCFNGVGVRRPHVDGHRRDLLLLLVGKRIPQAVGSFFRAAFNHFQHARPDRPAPFHRAVRCIDIGAKRDQAE